MNIRTIFSRLPVPMRWVILLGAIGIALFAVTKTGYTDRRHPALLSGREVVRVRGQITRVMRTKGPRVAYAYAKTLFPYDTSGVSQHLTMHIFAEVAYGRYGATAMAYCDREFSYGCYHGFLGQNIAREGLDAARDLFLACKDEPNVIACQHGIGHGIMQYMGHRRLKDALDACVQIGAPVAATGCFGGAYMEYHFPALSAGGAQTAMRFDPENPYDVCPELPTAYQSSCYFRLAEWWEQILSRNYRLMGGLCARIGESGMREQCFTAIGATSFTTGGHIRQGVIDACNQATGSPGYERYRDICLRGFDTQSQR